MESKSKQRLKRSSKPDMDAKPVKYLVAKMKGKSKKEAAIVAGYADHTHIAQIEKTQDYQIAKEYFKDKLLGQISMEDLAGELLKNVRQDEDKGAKNKAIEIALGKIEPDNLPSDEDERVVVVLKSG